MVYVKDIYSFMQTLCTYLNTCLEGNSKATFIQANLKKKLDDLHSQTSWLRSTLITLSNALKHQLNYTKP